MGQILDTVHEAIRTGDVFDWPDVRKAVCAAHEASQSVPERVNALQAHKELMDFVAQNLIKDQDRQEFQKIRKREFNLFLVSEARIGNNASVELMDEITRREIAAGRLAPDDELRKLTDDALTKPYMTKDELRQLANKPSVLHRIFGRRG